MNALKKINELESSREHPEFKLYGISLWPLIRVRMTDASIDSSTGKPRFSIKGVVVLALQFIRFLTILKKIPRLFSKQRAEGCMLFNNSSFISKIENNYVDRLLDPIVDEIKINGVKSVAFSFSPTLSASNMPKNYGSLTLLLGLVKVFSIVFSFINSFINKELINSIAHYIDKEQLNQYVSIKSLNQIAAYIFFASKVFKLILRLYRPEVAFVGVYYSGTSMAFILACKQLGIRVYDIQHGVQGAGHRAYRPWKTYYETLPSGFWCWDEISASHLKTWVDKNAEIVVGGNAWYEYLLARHPEWQNAEEEAKSSCVKRVLVTLQPLETPMRPLLLKAIEASDAATAWEIRMHPTMSPLMVENVKASIRKINHKKINVQNPIETPLPLALLRSNIHITEYSSVVIEALSMGLPNIVLNVQALELFKSYEDSGLINYADTLDELLTNIDNAAKNVGFKNKRIGLRKRAIGQILNLPKQQSY